MAHTRYHMPPEYGRDILGQDLYDWLLETHRNMYGHSDGTPGSLDGSNIGEIADLGTAETDTSKVLSPDGEGGLEWVEIGFGASFLVLELSDGLSDERVATGGDNIRITDGGANAAATFDVYPQGAGSGLDADLLQSIDGASYTLIDGTRAFTGTVGGVTPVDDADLVTKSYVDLRIVDNSEAIIGDEPSGTKNGVNTTFILSFAPSDDSKVGLWLNGLRLTRVTAAPAAIGEFRVQGTTITMFDAPASGDSLVADYVIQPVSELQMGGELSGTKNGVNVTFTTPGLLPISIVGGPAVYHNGLRLQQVPVGPGAGQFAVSGYVFITLGLAPAAADILYIDFNTYPGQ